MIGIEEQIKLFELFGTELKERTECVVIGGSAMLFYGLKTATKDIDLVFMSRKDRDRFRKLARKIGFKERETKVIEKYKEIRISMPILMERKETRLDLFAEEIFSLRLSEGIKERIKEVHEFGNFIVKVVSPEDIILLKSVTDREGDRLDAKDIANKFDINWDIVVKESVWQMENGKKIFPVFLYDFLIELKDLGVSIPKPILDSVRKIGEREMLRAIGKKKGKD
jgi:hypothetical protein